MRLKTKLDRRPERLSLHVLIGSAMQIFGSLALFSFSAAVSGQLLTPDGPRPEFEVATVRLSRPDAIVFKTRTYRGTFQAEHASLVTLIKFAYRIKADDEVVGLPSWSDSRFFDIKGSLDDQEAAAVEKLLSQR